MAITASQGQVMTEKPLITIIIPIYNVGKYIDKCIKSVLSQTYKNIELILVDDGTPDDAGSICDIHAKKDNRIKVIHKKNGGVSSARNAGLDTAKGAYIMFIDGDDWVDNDHVEYLLSLCKKDNSPMSMSYGIYTKRRSKEMLDKHRIISGIDMAADILYHKTVIGSYNKLFKRELIYSNNIKFNEKLFIGEGFNFIVKCAQMSETVSTGMRKTYHYRQDNPVSAMTKFNIYKIRNNNIALNNIKKDFKIKSIKLIIAWNYARWLTSLSFSMWMRLSNSNNKYPDDYKKMLRDIRFKAPWVMVSNVGITKKISAMIAIVSPSIIIRILESRKKLDV